jgi:hypothetical protein
VALQWHFLPIRTLEHTHDEVPQFRGHALRGGGVILEECGDGVQRVEKEMRVQLQSQKRRARPQHRCFELRNLRRRGRRGAIARMRQRRQGDAEEEEWI